MAPKGQEVVELTTSDRKALFAMLIVLSKDGELKHGSKSEVADIFRVAPSTVTRVCETTMKNMEFFLSNHEDYEAAVDLFEHLKVDWKLYPDSVFASLKAGKCGKKKSLDREALIAATRLLPLNHRKTYRKLAKELGISYFGVCSLLRKEKVFRRHTSALKPTLTEQNKWWRVEHALSKVDMNTILQPTRSGWMFSDLMNEVHIDEKWFFLCEDGASCILVTDEKNPCRHTKHKSHVSKVMFLCAQARPRHDPRTNTLWDGKIGMWPVGEWGVAERDSCNRPAGTPVWKNKNINAETYLDLLIDFLIPALIEKWPRGEWEDDEFIVDVQQDGAKAHAEKSVEVNFMEAMEELETSGMVPHKNKIRMGTQPSNSPDDNVCDLGFFNGIQSDYCQTAPRNVGELIEMVKMSYEGHPAAKINRIWLTYQSCLNEILKCGGSNDCKIPHMNKEKLEKEGRLPRVLPVCEEGQQLLTAIHPDLFMEMAKIEPEDGGDQRGEL